MERSPASRRGKTRRKAQIYFTSESCCLHFIVLLVKEWGEEGRGEGLPETGGRATTRPHFLPLRKGFSIQYNL